MKTKFNVRINVSSTALEKDEMKKRFITQNHGDGSLVAFCSYAVR